MLNALRIAPLLLLAACGRINFDGGSGIDGAIGPSDGRPTDTAGDTLSATHDEDSDGLPDSTDPCPHLAGDANDSDSDGVGDACDRNPTLAGDRIVLFSSLAPGDHPFLQIDDFVQEADGLHFNGLSTGPVIDRPFSQGRYEIGFEILGLVGTGQHQIASGLPDGGPNYYFTELNDEDLRKNVNVVEYSAANGYVSLNQFPHSGIHPGVGLLRNDVTSSPATFTVFAGWVGEMYSAGATTPTYAGGQTIQFVINGLDIVLRYVIVMESN